jgi:hypothetical protein
MMKKKKQQSSRRVIARDVGEMMYESLRKLPERQARVRAIQQIKPTKIKAKRGSSTSQADNPARRD